jgi:hypothetical protein
MAIQLHGDGDPLAPHSLSPTELQQLLAAERAGQPFLAYRDQLGRLCLYIAYDSDDKTATLGRRPEMDLSIEWDVEVSGLHAELLRLGGEWTIADDGLSTNGTYVNGKRISGRHRLRDGDRVRAGGTVLAFKDAKAPKALETVTAAERHEMHLTDTQRKVLIALCRPYKDGDTFATPATNPQIASEVHLSVDAVKMNLRTLFGKFALGDLPQSQKRARLAECSLQFGMISRRDLA